MVSIFPTGTTWAMMQEPGLRKVVSLIAFGYWLYLWYKLGKNIEWSNKKLPLKREIARFIGLLIGMLAFFWLILLVGVFN